MAFTAKMAIDRISGKSATAMLHGYAYRLASTQIIKAVDRYGFLVQSRQPNEVSKNKDAGSSNEQYGLLESQSEIKLVACHRRAELVVDSGVALISDICLDDGTFEALNMKFFNAPGNSASLGLRTSKPRRRVQASADNRASPPGSDHDNLTVLEFGLNSTNSKETFAT